MTNPTLEERWEQGIDHDPRSEKLVRAMAKIDFEQCQDSLQINVGGDGDNGETMMYLLDMHFAETGEPTVESLQEELKEREASFELRWDASQRAIKRWQKATGKIKIWPDHEDLCVWLLEQLDAQREA